MGGETLISELPLLRGGGVINHHSTLYKQVGLLSKDFEQI